MQKQPARVSSLRLVRPPRLEVGDRLTRLEFERRYEAMPDVKKAELIEGVVYMPSPVRHPEHGKPQSLIVTWLGVYRAYTPLTDFSDNATVRMDEINEPQPDALLFIDQKAVGGARIGPDHYIEGAPELIAEVAASSASYDLHDKLDAYQRNGVREYIVWRVEDGELDWFRLRGETYVRLRPGAGGITRSRVFPGLWLNVNALLADDLSRVLADLQKGLKSKEHGAFVKKLARKALTRSRIQES
ncbi:MAG: Uma2 family endonuclease [Blastocatellia bacterium]